MSFLFLWQGVLMIQDQYRAIMQYSVSKESSGHEKILTDWYCAKVNGENAFQFIEKTSFQFVKMHLKQIYFSLICSVVFSTSNVVTTASNAMHRVKKARKAEKEVMRSAIY